jgi:hypothetical protein
LRFDTVITLNYDNVVECAAKAVAAEAKAKAMARSEAPPTHGADADQSSGSECLGKTNHLLIRSRS